MTEADPQACQRSELQASPIMKDVADAVVDDLIAHGKVLDLKQGDPLLFQDVRGGHGLFVVLSGTMGVYRKTNDVDTLRIAQLGAGECLGEYSLLDGQPMSASARAMEATRLLFVPRSQFVALAEREPKAGCQLYRNLAAYLVKRLRAANV